MAESRSVLRVGVTRTGARCRAFGLQALVACLTIAASPAVARAQGEPTPAPAPAARPWPPGSPDLPADPALHFGQLENGLRYVWRQHARPPGRCSIRLVVQVGSLDEADDEHGMAHFVEHMAFNGTRRFPGNRIGEWFRARGMRFGQHANASTSMADTTYGVDLPASDAAAIRDGLDVLRQFADGVLFAPDEVEAEKAVVDAEQRERGTAPSLARAAFQQRLLAGSRGAERNVIGVAAERATFTAERLRAFHGRWYRADNITLVLVGDLAACDVDALCRDTFGSMDKPTTPAPGRVAPGLPGLLAPDFAIDEPGRADVEWFVQCLATGPAPPETAAALREAVVREAAVEMAWWLLADALRRAGSPVLAPRVDEVPWADEVSGVLVYFRCEPDRSAAALAECCRVLRALHPSEFSPALLDRVRTNRLAAMEQDLAAIERVPAAPMAAWLAAHIASGRVPGAPRFVHDLRRAAWNELTATTCAADWFGAWGRSVLSLASIGPPGHAIDTAGERRELEARCAARAVEAASDALPEPDAPPTVADDAEPAWPHAIRADTVPGVVAERRRDPVLDVEQVRFENGVRLLVKRIDGAAGGILVEANVGAGHGLLGDGERQAARLFELLVPEAGLRRVPSQTLRRLASTRAASVTVRTEPDRFVVAGRCDRASQAFQFEWLLAQATEPAFDAAAHRRVTESTGARYGFVGASVLGMRQAFAERLTGQAVGFLAERVAAVTLEQVQDLFAARWRGQPITLVVVGDLDVEATITIAARTFGTLPGRRAPDELAADLRYRPIERALQERLDLPAGETSSWIQFFVPLPDLQRSTIRRGHLLAALLRPRLASILREAMGATYDCQVEVQWFASAMPCGSISITAKVAPGREHDVEAAIRRELGSLVADGVTTEELNGARRQLRNVVQEARQNNAYWSVRLSWAHLRPAGLQEWTAAEDELQHLSAAQLSATAAQWCAAEHLSVLVLRAPAQAK